MEAIVTSDIITDWKAYIQLLVNKLEDNMESQLMELVSNKVVTFFRISAI